MHHQATVIIKSLVVCLCAVISLATTAIGQSERGDIRETAFDHGWCMGRAALILAILPENRQAQDVAFSSERAFFLDAVRLVGPLSAAQSEKLTSAIFQVRAGGLASAISFVEEYGRQAAIDQIWARSLPEMMRRCLY